MSQARKPKASEIPHIHRIHEHERPDPYYWMRQRDDPEVMEYIKAENTYCDAVMAPWKDLEANIYGEMVGRIPQKDESAPVRYKGYWYYHRFDQGKDYPVYFRKSQLDDKDAQQILDVNDWAKGEKFCQVSGLEVSPDGRYLAFGSDFQGRNIFTVNIKDLETGQVLEDNFKSAWGGSAWSADSSYLFYTVKNPQTLRAEKIMRHKLGTACEDDVLIYEEKDEAFIVDVKLSVSGTFIFIVSKSTVSTEYRLIPADRPESQAVVFHPRKRDFEYHLYHRTGEIFILHNGNAKNFKLDKCSEHNKRPEEWKEVIVHQEDGLLEDVQVFKDFVLIQKKVHGLTQIGILYDNGNLRYIPFDEECYTAFPGPQKEQDTPWLRFEYASLTTPGSSIALHFQSWERKVLKEQEVPGDFSKINYQSHRLFARANDGTDIPISLVYRKDLFHHGANPLLLYGYGAYGHSTDPWFSQARLSLLDRGFVFAIAHVRGGQELGRMWYDEGKLMHKKNTFTDFISCAEFLKKNEWGKSEGVYAYGGSAGGLLIGAVVNMRPDLWSGVVAAVPFVDVVTTMLDESIPLTTGEFDEWGNPKEPEYYKYILSYSPYDRVKAQDYPAILVTTGFHDSQVQYWEPAKWVARLRDMKTNEQPLLFKVNLEAGHGGASGRYQRLKEIAFEYSFLCMLENIRI